MNIDITSIAKEMAKKYEEEELKWILILKRLEKQGYGIYKIPQELLLEADLKELKKFNKQKKIDIKYSSLIEKKQEYNKPILVKTKENSICASCGKKIKSNKEGMNIQYCGYNYCFQCALPKIADWSRGENL